MYNNVVISVCLLRIELNKRVSSPSIIALLLHYNIFLKTKPSYK